MTCGQSRFAQMLLSLIHLQEFTRLAYCVELCWDDNYRKPICGNPSEFSFCAICVPRNRWFCVEEMRAESVLCHVIRRNKRPPHWIPVVCYLDESRQSYHSSWCSQRSFCMPVRVFYCVPPNRVTRMCDLLYCSVWRYPQLRSRFASPGSLYKITCLCWRDVKHQPDILIKVHCC